MKKTRTPLMKSQKKPHWNDHEILSSGANKDIHLGTFEGKDVAVCIARTTNATDIKRINLEMDIFKKLGYQPALDIG